MPAIKISEMDSATPLVATDNFEVQRDLENMRCTPVDILAFFLDTDDTLAANSDAKVPSQQAIKTYVDNEIADVVAGTAVYDAGAGLQLIADEFSVINLTTSMFASNVVDTDVTLAANSDTRLATQKAVKAYVAAYIAAQDIMAFKGIIDCSANPNYPAADAGNVYSISVAGKIGGASGPAVAIGDRLLCLVDSTASGNHATVGANWHITETNHDGTVTGPSSAVNNRLAVFNGTSGQIIADGGILVSAIPTGQTTVGLNLLQLANPGAVTFVRLNADNSVTARSAANMRIDLGSTTVGDALFTATNPSAVRYVRINADNSVTLRTAGEILADIGARTPAIQAVTSSATVTPTFDDDMVKITAQAAGLTLANPTGTAIAGAGMVIRIKDNGTARSITFGTQYRAMGVTLPTTTVISKTLYLGLVYNSDDTKWDVVAVAQEA